MTTSATARDIFCNQFAADIWNAIGASGKGARRPSFRTEAKRGAANGCRGKKHSAPVKPKRRPGRKALAAYRTQYTHVMTHLITNRRDRKGT